MRHGKCEINSDTKDGFNGFTRHSQHAAMNQHKEQRSHLATYVYSLFQRWRLHLVGRTFCFSMSGCGQVIPLVRTSDGKNRLNYTKSVSVRML